MKNKFTSIMKDERGLSLVELLAVVVIMAIVAGIGAVAISTVIQKAREDAGVSNVQQMINAANMYQMSPGEDGPIGGENTISIKTIKDNGFMSNIAFITAGKEETTVFTVDNGEGKGMVAITLEGGALIAGSKPNKAQTITEAGASVLTRDILFGEATGGE